jgi:hypothetical protein
MAPPGQQGATVKQPRRGGGGGNKQSNSRIYPRGVSLDFRKLTGLTLLSYIDHHGESRGVEFGKERRGMSQTVAGCARWKWCFVLHDGCIDAVQ